MKENDFVQFIDERLNESYSRTRQNKEYKTAQKNYSKLFQKIGESIKDTKLTQKYKEAEYDIHTMQLQQAYKTGLKDGITFFL